MSLVTAVVIYSGLTIAQLGVPTTMTGATDKYARIQERIAHELPNKVLYVAGSSGFYGVRCEQLTNLIGCPAVNLGLHAGLGLRYLMDRAVAASSSGDVIVLGPEWQLFHGPRFGEYACDYIMSRRPEYLRGLPLGQAIQLFLSAGPQRVLNGGYRLMFSLSPEPGDALRIETVNGFGDRVLTQVELNRQSGQCVNFVGALPRWRTPTAELMQDITRFSKTCKRKGVSVVAVFPPLCIDEPGDSENLTISNRGARDLWELSGIPVLGSIQDAMYGPADAFDTPYHLLPHAASVHTAKLALLLKDSGLLPQ